MIKNGEKYLVEARLSYKDGKKYDSVYGKCEIVDAEKEVNFMLKRSENWFIRVTGDTEEVIIPGCRVGIIVKCDTPIVNKSRNEAEHGYGSTCNVLLLP